MTRLNRVVNLKVGGFWDTQGPSYMQEDNSSSMHGNSSNESSAANVVEVVSISLQNLPQCGPWALANGPRAVQAAYDAMTAALDLVVHVRRCEDGVRRVQSVAEITGMESGTPLLQDVFGLELRRSAGSPRMDAHFRATGIVPRFIDDLRQTGVDVPMSLFDAREV